MTLIRPVWSKQMPVDKYAQNLCKQVEDEVRSEIHGPVNEFTAVKMKITHPTRLCEPKYYSVKVSTGQDVFAHLIIRDPDYPDVTAHLIDTQYPKQKTDPLHPVVMLSVLGSCSDDEEPSIPAPITKKIVNKGKSSQKPAKKYGECPCGCTDGKKMAMFGGWSCTDEASKHVKELCVQLKGEVGKSLKKRFNVFNAVVMRKQVVGGTNYLVKVDTGKDIYLHMGIFDPLPMSGQKPKLCGCQYPRKAQDCLDSADFKY